MIILKELKTDGTIKTDSMTMMTFGYSHSETVRVDSPEKTPVFEGGR